jgi:hypothetical protein
MPKRVRLSSDSKLFKLSGFVVYVLFVEGLVSCSLNSSSVSRGRRDRLGARLSTLVGIGRA